jgi:adenylate cyclase
MSQRRKLAAILSADVVGYSRLMSDDEQATVATLKAYREIFAQHIAGHEGRVVDSPGDALLAEFPSAIEAVQSAVAIQRELAGRNASLPEHRRMRFRIGVNLGDVAESDGALYGDGVNIAARLESLADPGGVCISGTVYDQVEGKLPVAFKFAGEQSVKNIPKPVRTYHARLDFVEASRAGGAHAFSKRFAISVTFTVLLVGVLATVWMVMRPSPTANQAASVAATKLPDEPSIAVLPFQNMSGIPEEDWFSDGLTETLITDLSRLNKLFVIARNSTFTYKGKSVDVRRVGDELGVRYVLEGSVQRTGDRLRLNAQLVDAQTGRHVWADRYDRKLADLFEVQDDLTQHIVTELDVTLLAGEQARAWRKTTRNPQAYELFLRGREHHERFTKEDEAKAQALLEQAVALDPKFAAGLVWLGWTHYNQGDSGWSPDATESYRKAVAFAEKAIAIDPSLGDAYALLTSCMSSLTRYADAVAAAEEAIRLSPTQADNLMMAGWTFSLNGRPNEAIPLVERALRLNPIPPDWYFGSLGDSLLFANRAEEAIEPNRKCVDRLPDFLWCRLGLAAAYMEVGKPHEAAVHVKEALRINPKITAADNAYVRSLGIPEVRTRIVTALRNAGLE